jgi:hypothetical protein
MIVAAADETEPQHAGRLLRDRQRRRFSHLASAQQIAPGVGRRGAVPVAESETHVIRKPRERREADVVMRDQRAREGGKAADLGRPGAGLPQDTFRAI